MRRVVAFAVSAVLAGAVIPLAVGGAQAPPPTVTITVGPKSVSVSGAENLSAGPTRIEFRTTSDAQLEGVLTALRPGRTVADLRRAIPRAERGPTPVKSVVTFEASGAPRPNAPYATTIDLRPGVTYAAANIAERTADTRLASFTVAGTTGSATRPTPAATVDLHDYAFGMPATLPRDGVVRFRNLGERLHIAVAFPVRRGRSRVAAVRALLRNQERRLGRLTNVRQAMEPLGVVSGGTVNDVELRFPRAGNWVFACFIEDGERGNPGHNSLGMVKAFRVR
jgi:hypothetical protein